MMTTTDRRLQAGNRQSIRCCGANVQRLVHQDGELEFYSLTNWQPVELSQNWSDAFAPSSVGDWACCGVLYTAPYSSVMLNTRELQ